jgi:hypothetical protein
MNAEGIMLYLADRVDDSRWPAPNQLIAPSRRYSVAQGQR